jgi:hypothetical protein
MSILVANYPVNWSGATSYSIGIGAAYSQAGQTFKLNTAGTFTVSSIDLPVLRVNAFAHPGTVAIEIYAVDGDGHPTGSALSSGSFNGEVRPLNGSPHDFDDIDINVALTPVDLSSGVTYALVMTPEASSITWYGTTSGYPDGVAIRKPVGGWENTSNDLGFRLWAENPLPEKVTYVSPAEDATDLTLHQGSEWNTAAYADSYTFRIIEDGGVLPTIIPGLTDLEVVNISDYLHLDYDTKYWWRVDSVNEYGTTEGDAWWFRTQGFEFVIPSWELLPGRTLGPLTGGVVGVDFRWLGDNNMVTTKRLVAAAYNRIWYEEF